MDHWPPSESRYEAMQRALIRAARRHQAGAIGVLLDAGASANHAVENAAGNTTLSPLAEAARAGAVDATRALLQRGAAVDHKDTDLTALMMAAANGHSVVCATLLDAGADFNAKSTGARRTALEYAVRGGHADVVNALFFGTACGALAVSDALLISAVEHGHWTTAKVLLSHRDGIGVAHAVKDALVQALMESPLEGWANDAGASSDSLLPIHVAIKWCEALCAAAAQDPE